MTKFSGTVRLETADDLAVVRVDNPPVNALSADVRAGLKAAFEAASANSDIAAIVLACDGRTFIAGADIREFGKPMQGPSLHDVEEAIENAGKPVVAAIHGTALGGGLEVALACHWRVAVPSAKCGLPEVKLGLLPGAGGTQRLPRLVGADAALKMVTGGDHVPAKKAHAMGLVDELAEEGGLEAAAIAFARKAVSEGKPLRRIRDMDEKLAEARANPGLFDDFRKANARKFRGFEAPEANIKCIEAAVNLPFDEGMKFERDAFMKLMTGSQSAAQRYVFFSEREAAKIPGLEADVKPRSIGKVAIIGAGTMGGGIAMNFANVGIPVTIIEMKDEALQRGLGVIRKNYENTAAKGRISADDVEKRMGCLTGSLELTSVADADLIIEAVFENMDIKKEVFTKLDALAKPGAILATNTSYLDVDEIASVTKRPGDVLGLHFFSPANVMRLLEIVRAEKTAPDVLVTALDLARRIGKVGVVAGVCHGFIGNRMLAARQREAQKLILEGAMPWDVDRVLYDFGMPMGPFQMGDLAGLDIGWSKETSKGETVRDLLCEMDRRGQKTGAGFYDYDEKRVGSPSPVTEKIILDLSAKAGIKRRSISDEEILERCLYPMVNEGAKILEEGKAYRASDIDIVWINGYGWPVYRGGPMFWGELVGLDKVLKRMQEFETTMGEDFKPSALLERLVKEGKGFSAA
ncbi:3-hydroxyacyl-CoA dehydrogenase NAD-binding domain-containing protein [Pseudokordiimonas caeni]|uniref:3-hydroxyacyl-CoA dehydrogenase NAD-binding domain-containing protein n=1 Tax=Pseudokordiimonas caeni TaxID=2997908 RepID=UPI003592ED1D